MFKRGIILFLLAALVASCGTVNSILAPKKQQDDDTPNLLLEDDEKPEADTIPDVEPKVKRNEFYGVKTKKAFTRNENRTSVIFELFHITREPVQVANYVRQVYYYDTDRNQVVGVRGRGQTLERVLHGPYKRTVNDIVVEEGMFYNGTKHEVWLNQRMDSTLTDKEHFHMGWYKDSEISYYDEAEKTKIKEVIPIRYGKKEGQYFLFYESGDVAVTGQYVFDKKVGVWSEYYNLPGISRVKKEVQYPNEFYDKTFQPFTRREWDRNAQLIYTSDKINQ